VPAVLIPEVSDEEVQLFAFRVAVCAKFNIAINTATKCALHINKLVCRF